VVPYGWSATVLFLLLGKYLLLNLSLTTGVISRRNYRKNKYLEPSLTFDSRDVRDNATSLKGLLLV